MNNITTSEIHQCSRDTGKKRNNDLLICLFITLEQHIHVWDSVPIVPHFTFNGVGLYEEQHFSQRHPVRYMIKGLKTKPYKKWLRKNFRVEKTRLKGVSFLQKSQELA